MEIGGAGGLGLAQKVTGPGASSLKYDILTALLVTAARGDKLEARLAMRLALLITARFNWRLGTFAVGQREMARMWGVTERTAKREVAEMRARGWIGLQAAAARGRVAQYRLDLPALVRATMPHWQAVGPDFAERMGQSPPEPGQGASNVVPLRRPSVLPPSDGTLWPDAARRLEQQDRAIYSAWFAQLQFRGLQDGQLTLATASRFVADYIMIHHHARLLAAVAACDPRVTAVQVVTV